MACIWLESCFAIGWTKYRLGKSQLQCILGSHGQWEFPQFFKGHWQSPCTALTAGKCLPLGPCKKTVKESTLIRWYRTPLNHDYTHPQVVTRPNNQRAIVRAPTPQQLTMTNVRPHFTHVHHGIVMEITSYVDTRFIKDANINGI